MKDEQDNIRQALEEYFEGRKSDRFVDTNRIPFICDDIKLLREAQEKMASDLKWMKYIGGGFVAAAGMLALKSLGV